METIIAVTGHRPGKLNKEYDYIGPYSDYLRKKIKKVLIYFLVMDSLAY